MERTPEIFESLQVPETRPVRCGQTDFLRQVRDLPVMPDVGVRAFARVLRTGDEVEVVDTGQRGRRKNHQAPVPRQWCGLAHLSRRDLGRAGSLQPVLVL